VLERRLDRQGEPDEASLPRDDSLFRLRITWTRMCTGEGERSRWPVLFSGRKSSHWGDGLSYPLVSIKQLHLWPVYYYAPLLTILIPITTILVASRPWYPWDIILTLGVRISLLNTQSLLTESLCRHYFFLCTERERSMARSPITRNGYNQLHKELENLKKVVRPQVIKAIEEARAHGDISENAEFQAAKEKQSFVEGRSGRSNRN